MFKKCAVLMTLVVASSGCSNAEEKIWNESEVVDALNLSQGSMGVGFSFVSKDGVECNVAAVLTTKTAVELYRKAGDVVASNPSGAAGVKIVTKESRHCLESAEAALSSLE